MCALAGLRDLSFGGAATLPWVVVIVASFAATVVDVRTRKVPIALTAPLFFLGLLWALITSFGPFGPDAAVVPKGVGDSLLGACVAGVPFVILWIAVGTGAGDAKLMLAIGTWLGVAGATLVLVCTAVAGGVLAIAWAVMAGRLFTTVAGVPRAATDFVFVFLGPGRLQDRRELVAATAAATTTEPVAVATSAAAGVDSPRPMRRKMPYAAAIFAGTCLSGLRVYLS